MWKQLQTSILVLLVMTVLTGVLYPMAVTMFAQTLFPHQANGSLIVQGDKLVGSEQIGQSFSEAKYFWGRLSATAPVPYNAAASSGSNLGPLNPALVENVKQRIDALKQADATIVDIPVDLVTASGSGLDPHISVEAAQVQVNRVATARKIDAKVVSDLVKQHTQPAQWGFLGQAGVNVLELNMALDQLQP